LVENNRDVWEGVPIRNSTKIQVRLRTRWEVPILPTFSFPYLLEFRHLGWSVSKCAAPGKSAIDLRRKGSVDESGGVVRIFFWEKVPALHCSPLRVRSPLPPNAERTIVFCIERVEWATLGPEMQHWAFDSSGRFLVGTIVFDIRRCRGSIFLADSMNAGPDHDTWRRILQEPRR
jgi:hypothetical protein